MNFSFFIFRKCIGIGIMIPLLIFTKVNATENPSSGISYWDNGKPLTEEERILKNWKLFNFKGQGGKGAYSQACPGGAPCPSRKKSLPSIYSPIPTKELIREFELTCLDNGGKLETIEEIDVGIKIRFVCVKFIPALNEFVIFNPYDP